MSDKFKYEWIIIPILRLCTASAIVASVIGLLDALYCETRPYFLRISAR